MKQLIAIIIACCFFVSAKAQTPQYSLTPYFAWDSLKPEQSPLRAVANAWQSIYYHSDFPGMPATGTITHFYVSVGTLSGNTAADSGCLVYGYRVKMMQTNIDSFGNVPQAYAYPYTVAPQVFYQS